MSLVHLAIATFMTLAGLSILQPHVPPAICPYSHKDMSRKHLLYHAYSSISELVKLCDVDVTYCLGTVSFIPAFGYFIVRVHYYFCDMTIIRLLKLPL